MVIRRSPTCRTSTVLIVDENASRHHHTVIVSRRSGSVTCRRCTADAQRSAGADIGVVGNIGAYHLIVSLLYEERISLNYATWSTFPIQPRSTVHTRPKTDGRSRKSDISSTPPKLTGGGDTHITTLQSVDAYVWPRYSREGYPETTPWMASLWTPFGVGNNHAQCCMSDLQPVVGYGIRNSRFGPGAHTARVRGSGTTKRGLRSRIG